jgi:MFS family permease
MLLGIGLAGIAFGLTTIGQGLLPVSVAVFMLAVGTALVVAYVLHARGTKAPVLDLKLLSVPTFRASIIGGSLFRVGIGAMVFLLPLLFQLGFELSAFASGALTFAGAIGAILMRATAAPILRRFGIKRVVVYNAAIAAGMIAACALFVPGVTHAFIIAMLLIGGFFRSLQFTSMNSLAYADLETKSMSQATSFTSVAQQLSISAGVTVAALVLETLRYSRGTSAILVSDFQIAFLIVGAISLSCILFVLRLPKDAGSALTRRVEQAEAAASETDRQI